MPPYIPGFFEYFLGVAIILVLPVGAFVLRKHRRNARGPAKWALNTLTALAILTVPLLLMLALTVLVDFIDTLWQIAGIVQSDLRGVFAVMIAFAVLLTAVRLIRGPNKILRLRP